MQNECPHQVRGFSGQGLSFSVLASAANMVTVVKQTHEDEFVGPFSIQLHPTPIKSISFSFRELASSSCQVLCMDRTDAAPQPLIPFYWLQQLVYS